MGLVDHARNELERAGLFDSDSDYNGALGNSILDVVETFAKHGHSGASAGISIQILNKLLNWEPLTPLTTDPKEWIDRREMTGCGNEMGWQNSRKPDVFSDDGGKTGYQIKEPSKKEYVKLVERE